MTETEAKIKQLQWMAVFFARDGFWAEQTLALQQAADLQQEVTDAGNDYKHEGEEHAS